MFDPTSKGWQTSEAVLVALVLGLGNTVFHHQLDREKVLGSINLVAPVAYVASRTIVKAIALWRGAAPVTALPSVTTPHPSPETSLTFEPLDIVPFDEAAPAAGRRRRQSK